MRQLQNNEVKAVAGAGLFGLLWNVGQTTGAVVKPVVDGAVQTTSTVVQPVATGTVKTLKWLLF